MKKPKLFIISIAFVILVLSVVQVVVSNGLSTTGTELGRLQEEIGRYQTETAILSEKVLIASSLTQVASSAGALGFLEPKSQVYISSPLPIARR